MAEKLATLSFSDGTPSVDFPVLSGSVGPDVIDVRALYGKTGKFTYDPGFMSTASCRSSITYIDGDKGILQYRGYPIEQLAEQCGWLMATEVLAAGLDISFAPVLDLDHQRSAVVGSRAFEGDPERATRLAGAFIRGLRQAGMAATGKHFPGHGWAEADSHVAIPSDERSLEHGVDEVLAARLDGVWSKVVDSPYPTSAFVIHGGLIKYLIARSVHFQGELKPRFPSAHTGITALAVRPGGHAYPKFFNDTSHLTPDLVAGPKRPWIEDPVTKRWLF